MGTITLNELTEIKITDGTNTLAIEADGSLVISANDLDIRNLNSTDDKVAVETIKDADGHALDINADGSLNIVGTVETTPASFADWKATQQTVTTTASQLAATALVGRLAMTVQNLGGGDIYIGKDNTVTAANGLKIAKNASEYVELDDGATIWAIAGSGTANVRIAEYKG